MEIGAGLLRITFGLYQSLRLDQFRHLFISGNAFLYTEDINPAHPSLTLPPFETPYISISSPRNM
jgi:hypothetical protein